MTMLEDTLREVFASRVANAPAVDDPATVAIRRARLIRRRRTAMTGATAAVLLVVALGAALSLRGWWERPTTAVVGPGPALPLPHTATPTGGGPLEAPVYAAGVVWTVDGKQVDLDGPEPVRRAYRTPLGWVYGGTDTVRLLPDGGVAVELITDVDGWLPRADGAALAAVTGGELLVAPISAAGLGDPATAPVPAGTTLVAYPDERVFFAGPGGAWYDYWHPAQPYQPTPTEKIATVFDGMVDGGLVGLVKDADGYCIAAIIAGPDGLTPADRLGCGLGLLPALPTEPAGAGWLAPGGAWLALPAGQVVWLVELADITDGDRAVARLACPREPGTTPVWVDASTLLSSANGRAVRCRVDGTTERVELPPDVAVGWRYTPVLGPPA